MTRIFFAVAAASMALAACGEKAAQTDTNVTVPADEAAASASPDASATSNAITGANDPQEYVTQAASADQFEIQSSQLILMQSKNAAVREFAQQMIEDHRSATVKLQVASTAAALRAPRPEMLAAHQARLTELQGAGANIDALYLDQQREAHAEAIALNEAMSGNSAAPAQLSAHAREMLPTLQGHAKMLGEIKLTA